MNMQTISGVRDWAQLREIAVNNPGASILLAWKLVEMLLYVKANTEKAAVTEDWATELPTIAFRLGSGRRVTAVLEDLLDKRNMTERGVASSPSDALDYIDAAETALRGWLGKEVNIADYLRFGGAGS